MEELSLYQTSNVVNEALTIVYTPDSSVYKYNYQVFKDNILFYESDTLYNETNIVLNSTGNYKVVVNEYNRRQVVTIRESGTYQIDLVSPIINTDDSIIVTQNNSYTLPDLNITAYDNYDNDVTYKVNCNLDSINFKEVGHHDLVCFVEDNAGNQTVKQIDLYVQRSNVNVLFSLQLTLE